MRSSDVAVEDVRDPTPPTIRCETSAADWKEPVHKEEKKEWRLPGRLRPDHELEVEPWWGFCTLPAITWYTSAVDCTEAV